MMNPEDFATERAAIAEEFRLRNNPAEVSQNEANEPRYKLIENIIQYTPFTVSEMKKLEGVLAERRRASEVQEEWIKTNLSGDSPPIPDVALRMIFTVLPTKDILSCRLVSHGWRSEATMVLRKRVSKFFTICSPDTGLPGPVSRNESGRRRPWDNLWKFLGVMQKSQLLPVVSFHLGFEHHKKPKHSAGIEGFFQLFGPVMQNLTLDFTYLRPITTQTGKLVATQMAEWPIDIQKYLGSVQLEKLLNLEFIFDSPNNNLCPSLGEQVRVNIMTTSFTAATAGNLQHIRFISDRNLVELVQSVQATPLAHLTRLTLECFLLMEPEIEKLGQIKMKRLSLKVQYFFFTTDVMTSFLQKQSPNLEYLKLFPYHMNNPRAPFPVKFVYEFPKMEKLKVFSIEYSQADRNDGRRIFCCSPINWPECFPVLEELKLRDRIGSDCFESLFHDPVPVSNESNIHRGLKVIDYPQELEGEFHYILHKISDIFPNLVTVILPFRHFHYDYDNFCYIWPLFPHMKKLVLHLGYEILKEKDVEGRLSYLTDSLKELAWQIYLRHAEVDFFCERLEEMALEMKIANSTSALGFVRKRFDATWFLRLIRERAMLEKMVSEQEEAARLARHAVPINVEPGVFKKLPEKEPSLIGCSSEDEVENLDSGSESSD